MLDHPYFSSSCVPAPGSRSGDHYEQLIKYAIHKINDIDLAKDLVQDTILTAIVGHEKFKQCSAELTWLTAILKYKIYRAWRNKAKHTVIYVNYELLPELTLQSPQRQYDDLINNLDGKCFESALNSFINTLPINWQQLYRLKYLCEVEKSVILQKLDLTESNYWVMTHRLKKALREWYIRRQKLSRT